MSSTLNPDEEPQQIVKETSGTTGALGPSDSSDSGSDVAGAKREAMFRLETGRRRPAFNYIQTAHFGGAVEPPLVRVVLRQSVETRVSRAGEEVRIERENYVSSVELILRVKIIAEGCLRCRTSRITVHGVVLDPLCIREGGLPLLPLRG